MKIKINEDDIKNIDIEEVAGAILEILPMPIDEKDEILKEIVDEFVLMDEIDAEKINILLNEIDIEIRVKIEGGKRA